MPRILVFGASGKTGREIVSQALARGWQVAAVVRDPAKLGIRHERLVALTGDMADRASLDRAMHGSAGSAESGGSARSGAAAQAPFDAVVSALGVYSKEPTTALSEGTRDIVGAMQQAGLRRIVIVSSLGAGDSHGQGSFPVRLIQRFILKQVLIDKTRQEEILRSSGLEWTSLRPPQLTDAPTIRGDLITWSGPVQPTQRLNWKVTRASVARYVLDAFEQRRWIGEAVCLAEPAK